MRKMLFFVVFIVLHLTAKGQDPTPDAWVEDNSNTAITLPPNLGVGSNLRGLISILKTPSDSTLEQIQEVENVLPELVSHNESGTKFLNYDGLTPVLVEAIKEQQQLLQLQAAQIKELQKEIEKLKKR